MGKGGDLQFTRSISGMTRQFNYTPRIVKDTQYRPSSGKTIHTQCFSVHSEPDAK